MAERGDQQHLRIAGVDEDAADLLRILKADPLPAMATVERLEHSLALGNVGAHVRLTRADIDHAVVRRGGRESADGSHGRRIEHGVPRAPGVGRFPDASVDRPEIEMIGLSGNPGGGEHPAAAERSDGAPFQGLQQVRIDLRRRARGSSERDHHERERKRPRSTHRHLVLESV